MRFRLRNRPSYGPDTNVWAVWGVLAVAVLVPAVCVLWFMSRAMHNERLATTQRLTEHYTNHLGVVSRGIDTYWEERMAAVEGVAGETAASRFAKMVRAGQVESVFIWNEAQGGLGYPFFDVATSVSKEDEGSVWESARELEFQKKDYLEAAARYGEIAGASATPDLKARALMAQANCLFKVEEREGALALLQTMIGDASLVDAVDSQGSLVVPNAQFRLLTLLDDSKGESRKEIRNALIETLNNYDAVSMPALQRRFLMEQVLDRSDDAMGEVRFPTLEAERRPNAWP